MMMTPMMLLIIYEYYYTAAAATATAVTACSCKSRNKVNNTYALIYLTSIDMHVCMTSAAGCLKYHLAAINIIASVVVLLFFLLLSL